VILGSVGEGWSAANGGAPRRGRVEAGLRNFAQTGMAWRRGGFWLKNKIGARLSVFRTNEPAHGGLNMDGLLRIVCVAGAVVIANSHARAAEKTMPTDFVGDWCFQSKDAANTAYILPSWTEDGHCTDILSIDKSGFYFVSKERHCEPLDMRLGKNTAPSGTEYTVTVTARCQPDGPVTAGELQSFKFSRYKGNLSVTTK
jgi:hypothetical protein